MPKEIELEDGTVETVYEQSEVDELNQTTEKMTKAFDDLRVELGIEKDGSIKEKLGELKEQANPNFGKYRAKFNAMEKELKNAGKQFDDDGNVIEGQKPVSMEEIEKMTLEATEKALSQEKRNALLSSVPEDSRETVDAVLTKLEATGGDLQENFNLAIAKAMPGQQVDPIASSINNVGGGNPVIGKQGKEKFTDTEAGKSLLDQIVPQPKEDKK